MSGAHISKSKVLHHSLQKKYIYDITSYTLQEIRIFSVICLCVFMWVCIM